MGNQNSAIQNPRKKKLITIIVILGVIAVAVISAVIYYGTKEEKTPVEKQLEEKTELLEEITNMSGKEAENKEEMIAKIKSIVSGVMSGNNNLGTAYLKDNWVDRRITEREEYFAVVEYNADEYEVVTDYKDKTLRDLAAIKLKCAEFFKAVYENENKVYLATCKAFQSDDELREAYRVTIEREASEGVDWGKDAQTLASEVLPSVWTVDTDDFWLYE